MFQIRKRCKYEKEYVRITHEDKSIKINREKFILFIQDKMKDVSEKNIGDFHTLEGALIAIIGIHLNNEEVELCANINSFGKKQGEGIISNNEELNDIIKSLFIETTIDIKNKY